MVGHHRVSTQVDSEDLVELTQPLDYPCLAVLIVLAGEVIGAAKIGAPYAAADHVVNTGWPQSRPVRDGHGSWRFPP